MLYKIHYSDFVWEDEAQGLHTEWWLARLDEFETLSDFADAACVYCTRPFQQPLDTSVRRLSEYAPPKVKEEYEKALRVKTVDSKSFAMLIRRTLEAVCLDKGLPSDEPLKKNIKKLFETDELRTIAANIAGELVLIGNASAHVRPRIPRETEQVDVIDAFFHFVVNQVYEGPALLESYRECLGANLPELISDDMIN